MFNWSTQDIFPHPSAENGHDLVDVGIRNDAPDQVERSWSPPPRQALLIENLWVHMGGFRAWRWVWHALITCQQLTRMQHVKPLGSEVHHFHKQ